MKRPLDSLGGKNYFEIHWEEGAGAETRNSD